MHLKVHTPLRYTSAKSSTGVVWILNGVAQFTLCNKVLRAVFLEFQISQILCGFH